MCCNVNAELMHFDADKNIINNIGITETELKSADLVIIGNFETINRPDIVSIPILGKMINAYKIVFTVKVIKNLKGICDKTIKVTFYSPVETTTQDWSIATGFPVLLVLKNQDHNKGYELYEQPTSWLTLSQDISDKTECSNIKQYINYLVLKILNNSSGTISNSDLNKFISQNNNLHINLGEHANELYELQSRHGIRQALGTIINLKFDSTEIRTAIRAFWTHDGDDIKITALETSLSLGDISALDYCISYWKNHPDKITRGQMELILSDAAYHLKDIGDMNNLLPFLEYDIPAARLAAMRIIRDEKNPKYLKAMIKGLSDTDGMVQQQSIMGIYDLDPELFIEENIQAPGVVAFKTDPKHYVSIWKKWLNEGGLQKLKADLKIK